MLGVAKRLFNIISMRVSGPYRMTQRTPEYDCLRALFHEVCQSISKQPSTIAPLANDLCGKRLISEATKDAATWATGLPPYNVASQIVNAVHTKIGFTPGDLYVFLDKLKAHGHSGVADLVLEECSK